MSIEGFAFPNSTDNAGLKSQELREALLAEGKIDSEMFDKEVAQTPRARSIAARKRFGIWRRWQRKKTDC